MAGAYEGPVDPDSAASLAGLAFEQASGVMQQAVAQARQASVSAASAAASAADAKAAQAAFGVTYRWNGTTVQFRTPDGAFGPGADLRGPAGGIGKTPVLSIGTVVEGDLGVEISTLDPEKPVLDFSLKRGAAAWTPVPVAVADGERRVLQIADWFGGEGAKPATGRFMGPAGLVTSIADATDVRGAPGRLQAKDTPSSGQLAVWVDPDTLAAGGATTPFGLSLVGIADAEHLKAELAIEVADVDGAAPLDSAHLTGTPTAPTAPPGTVSGQIATMQAIQNALASLSSGAPLDSPHFTGVPTAPTAALGTSTKQIATMEALSLAIAAVVNGAPDVLNTIRELADAIGDDPTFAADILAALALRLRFDAAQALTLVQRRQGLKNLGALGIARLLSEVASGGAHAQLQARRNIDAPSPGQAIAYAMTF